MTPKMIRDRWNSGEVVYGYWVAIPDIFALELALTAKFDYVCLDQQHGMIDYVDLAPMFALIEANDAIPIVRVPSRNEAVIGRVLDAGAMGVVVPMIETVDQAEAVVSASRYSPFGIRSFGPIRASVSRGTSSPRELEDVLCVVMVETRTGLGNLERIAETDGIDAIYVGPADLALSLGLPPALESEDREHATAIERIRDQCQKAGIGAGIQCSNGTAALERVAAGFNMVTVAKDSSLVMAAARKELLGAKGMDSSSYSQHYA